MVKALGRAKTPGNDQPTVRVVERDDTTYSVPHERVVGMVSVDLCPR
jgi:hypothetical protein